VQRAPTAVTAELIAVDPGSPAAEAGLEVGDELVSIDGGRPRDVIEYQHLVDGPDPQLVIERGGERHAVAVAKGPGEPLGVEIRSAVFDQVRTCDNHCEFCFIHQLPPGLRESLYVKDDDYRLSFLYGNYTTLTRFTESDLERVITERLSPLNVSIHATDPGVRTAMLRNKAGGTSLRWLRALLDEGIEVHGQVVVCPGVNNGSVLDDTLLGVLDRYPELASVCVVPLGISDHGREPGLRFHTADEAGEVLDTVHAWQQRYLDLLGRRVVFAADEYYLLADRAFPESETYEGFAMHEDGIGMARTFEAEFRQTGSRREGGESTGVRPGFFAWVDGAPAAGYRSPRSGDDPVAVTLGPRRDAPIAVLTGEYGARILGPLLSAQGRGDVRVVPVENRFFGGNVAVAGLMVGEDVARTLADEPTGHRYLLPDVCLSGGRFLDGVSPVDLPRPVEVVASDGLALRAALDRGGP
jgi:putative radical SAM enzyme (TIGR03279 family)